MQNHIEHEAKILDIDKNKVIHRLERLGARKILNTVTVIETYDVNPAIKLKKKINDNSVFSPILEKIQVFYFIYIFNKQKDGHR